MSHQIPLVQKQGVRHPDPGRLLVDGPAIFCQHLGEGDVHGIVIDALFVVSILIAVVRLVLWETYPRGRRRLAGYWPGDRRNQNEVYYQLW